MQVKVKVTCYRCYGAGCEYCENTGALEASAHIDSETDDPHEVAEILSERYNKHLDQIKRERETNGQVMFNGVAGVWAQGDAVFLAGETKFTAAREYRSQLVLGNIAVSTHNVDGLRAKQLAKELAETKEALKTSLEREKNSSTLVYHFIEQLRVITEQLDAIKTQLGTKDEHTFDKLLYGVLVKTQHTPGVVLAAFSSYQDAEEYRRKHWNSMGEIIEVGKNEQQQPKP